VSENATPISRGDKVAFVVEVTFPPWTSPRQMARNSRAKLLLGREPLSRHLVGITGGHDFIIVSKDSEGGLARSSLTAGGP
jgi:hypothetical protein